MADVTVEVEDSVIYYCREKLFRTMQIAAVQGMNRHSGDPIYKLYYYISLIHEARDSEATDGLAEIANFPSVSLACTILLYHLRNGFINFDQVFSSQVVKDKRSNAGDIAMYIAGVVMILLNKPEKARPLFIQPSLTGSDSLRKRTSILLGWIELLAYYEPSSKETLKYFENADNSSPEVVFGHAKYFEKEGNFIKALEHLSQGSVLFPNYPPVFIEKMKIHVTLKDWDEAMLAADRALFLDENCIEALRFTVIHMLTQGAESEEIEEKLKTLFFTMSKGEPRNSDLFCETAQLISGLSGLHKPILEYTYSMARNACDFNPTEPDTNAEFGYQCLHLRKFKKAQAIFENHACERSISGFLLCLVYQEEIEKAVEHIKIYQQLQTEMKPDVLYLHAFVEDKVKGSSDTIVDYLAKSLKLYLESLKDIPWSISFYRLLQPKFVHDVFKLFIMHIPHK
ncbi:tetratricopeptide repeat protein 21B-like, partial [Stegodyphus dumicola]|uniref:tetratricopeptide repeat protein 21B-like n=1 Tax=Stegodyphus dumicola TaxID=202533 RepID=UPI0015AC572B